MQVNSQIKSIGKQAGYTLIELSIAIAIISVLIMTALFGVQKILENNNADTTSQQVTLATANINKYATMLSDKTFVAKTADASALGIWPDNILTKVAGVVTKVSNPFGGEYIVMPAPNGYYIGITGLSSNGCLSVAASLSSTALTIDTDESVVTAATVLYPAAVTNVKTAAAKATGTLLAAGCAPSAAGKKKTVWAQYAL
jgi:prepilin-type N-terminal cleavage/methylation domain-containing protein